MKPITILMSCLILGSVIVSADARPRSHHHYHTSKIVKRSLVQTQQHTYPNDTTLTTSSIVEPVFESRTKTARRDVTIVPNPRGCPSRLFCACGVSMKIWGHAKHMAARAFFKYPPAAPGSGMVAAKRHHVIYIEAYLGNGMARVYNPNSGGHQTREMVMSLAGYSIRNPNG